VSLDEPSVPSGSNRARRKGAGIVSRNAVTQEDVVLSVHVERFDVEVLEEPPSICADPGEASVPLRFHRSAATGQEVSRRLSKVAVDTDTLNSEAKTKRTLTRGHICLVLRAQK
jgi:hypothetical protein